MENNQFDELLYSLPDYITGELNDDNVKEQIEAKLLTDSYFREEHDSLKSTMNFIRETELESPSEVYFANLQANILSKVHKEEAAEKPSVLAKLLGYWKVVVPALTVCIVFIIYANNINTPELPLKENKVQTLLSDTQVSKNNDVTPNNEVVAKDNSAAVQDNNTPVIDADINAQKHKRSSLISSNENIPAEDNTVYTEEGDGSIIFGKEDDTQIQDEYDNLSTDDQLDILQSLKEKKL